MWTDSELTIFPLSLIKAVCGVLDGSTGGALESLAGFGQRQLDSTMTSRDFSAGITSEPTHLNKRQLQNIDATIKLTEGLCQDITVNQILATPQKKSDQAININVGINNVQLFCFGTVEFNLVGYEGRASFKSRVRVSGTDVDVLLVSTDLNNEFPTTGCVSGCRAPVTVDSLNFDDVSVDNVPDQVADIVVEALTEPVTELVEKLGGKGK